MKIEKRTIFALTASLLGLGFGPQALAQEDTVFEEVIVTATKRELSIYDVPVGQHEGQLNVDDEMMSDYYDELALSINGPHWYRFKECCYAHFDKA